MSMRLVMLLTVLLAVLLVGGCREQPAESTAPPPLSPGPSISATETVAVAFVGRDACAECHDEQVQQHAGSDHDLAMQEVSAATVQGDFENASFEAHGVRSTFTTRDGVFTVRTDGPDGALTDYPVSYVFGVRPLEQYLVELPDGRYQALGTCWDSRPADEGGQRWFHLYPDEPIDHADELHWTALLQNWNHMCAECHSTGLRKNYIADEDRFETTWSEIDVSCEACHGPGSAHVAWARRKERLDRPDPDDATQGLLVQMRVTDDQYWTFDDDAAIAHRNVPLESKPEIDACGRCHSRRLQVWPDYEHGAPLADTHRLALLDEGLYHADGQIRDEVYVYGSFLQSKMHQKGVTCSDCHDGHTGRLRLSGNDLCSQCHKAAVYDTPEHHHHEPGGAGSACVECHMIERNYMVVDPRHDHSFRIPRPDLTERLGTPNACTDCHADQPASWATQTVAHWYGPELAEQFHYGKAIDAGRRGTADAPELLRRVIEDDEMPGIVRATAVSLLDPVNDSAAPGLIERAASDDEPLVRRAAAERLQAVEASVAVRIGAPLLEDPVRTVRLEAASTLAGARRLLPARSLTSLDAAIDEFRAAQAFNADRPEAYLNLGNVELSLGRAAEAERAFRMAAQRDEGFVPAWVNLADLLRATGRDEESERALRRALQLAPGSATTHHALGLALIRSRQLDEALTHLAEAARRQPGDARFAFVYAVALHDTGDTAGALAVLEAAYRANPGDRDVLGALMSYCMEAGRIDDAREWGARLQALSRP